MPPLVSVHERERVHRVTVRGRFHQLSDETRRYLVHAQPEHDIFVSAYTAEGTFTYDERIAFFNLRYEIRGAADDEAAGAAALDEATTFLRTMGFGFQGLRVDVVDAGAIWDDVTRRRSVGAPSKVLRHHVVTSTERGEIDHVMDAAW